MFNFSKQFQYGIKEVKYLLNKKVKSKFVLIIQKYFKLQRMTKEGLTWLSQNKSLTDNKITSNC